jgi:flagellar protein FliO/FliZ
MSNPTQPNQPKPTRLSPALIGAGILVIALGFGLPMLTPGAAPELPRDPNAKQAAPAPIQAPEATGLGPALLRMAVGLAVVCALCVFVARWIGQKPPAAPGAMEVVASITVAQCVLHLVRTGGRRLLIGTDLAGVKAVVELPGPEPELPPEPPAAPAAAPSPLDEAAVPLVPAPPASSAPPPTTPPTTQEILDLILRLRDHPGAAPPG